ncbi:hypothetical protein AN639_06750 [Candidatus Epulonipiscium fishelsonii]|uniref:Uncharacterized protein n=1 Tax=Candidatus Epulonipiscium fishelsonii TaxID=77094 RepID=A0ACC8X7R1_9FIRM|nr:hypothetical protein AN396_12235 [Epulopiscium sp. SCG-B11WGA-EpuloA1]ONI39028.1 hypothetical protein AN639_06750 [Epulopiscium sp. SCG-B05WGA-EpuloA1]
MVKISIIVPIYNAQKYLDRSISNIMYQSFKEIEIILVDDGSNDNSLDICKKYAKEDNRIRIISQKNSGAGQARNAGIKLASPASEYYMFFDADDFMETQMVETMYNAITSGNYDLVICNSNEISANTIAVQSTTKLTDKVYSTKQACRNDYIELMKLNCANTLWNKIYKASIIKEHNIKFPSLPRGQDAVFNCDYFNYVNSMKTISDVLYNYVLNDLESRSKKFTPDNFNISLKRIKHWESVFKKWNIWDKNAKVFLANYLLLDTVSNLFYSQSPEWNWSLKKQLAYINKLINHKEVKQAVEIANPKNIFNKINLRVIKTNYTLLIYCFTKACIILRKYLNKDYFFIRKLYDERRL